MIKSGYSSRGGRECNEDFGAVFQNKAIICAVLADGLGGHGQGDVASHEAVDVVKKQFKEKDNQKISGEDLEEWFYKANEAVLQKQSKACQMKTTLAVLCLDEAIGLAQWAHVGDSRIYHFENGKEVSCTFDHSVSRMAVLSGEISLDKIRFHEDRSKLLRVVGKEGMAKPECGSCHLSECCHHAFLLCTDGFWEYVTEADMERTLKEAGNPENWLFMMRGELEKRVDGTNDNHSAIAIFM